METTEQLTDLYWSRIAMRSFDQIEEDEMGRTRGTYETEETWIDGHSGETVSKETQMGY